MCIDVCVLLFRVIETYLLYVYMLFIFTTRFIQNEFMQIKVALHLINTLCFIKIYFHCILIILVKM